MKIRPIEYKLVVFLTFLPGFFERVIWPSQRLIFEAPLEAELEIYTGEMASAILSAKISCDRLQIHPISNSSFFQ